MKVYKFFTKQFAFYKRLTFFITFCLLLVISTYSLTIQWENDFFISDVVLSDYFITVVALFFGLTTLFMFQRIQATKVNF